MGKDLQWSWGQPPARFGAMCSHITMLLLQVSHQWRPCSSSIHFHTVPTEAYYHVNSHAEQLIPILLLLFKKKCLKTFIRWPSLAFNLFSLFTSSGPLGHPHPSLGVSCQLFKSSLRSSAKNPPTLSGWGHPYEEESRWAWPFFLIHKEETVHASPKPPMDLP